MSVQPIVAHRGRFASRYAPCRVCDRDLLDASGRGLHPGCGDSDVSWWTPEEWAEWSAKTTEALRVPEAASTPKEGS